jgi:DNA replication and repair protein RecF
MAPESAGFTRIKGAFAGKINQLEVFFSPEQSAVKVNDVIVGGNDFVGALNVVLFHPADMNLLFLGPDLRRRYLNTLLSQTQKQYLQKLLTYNQVLKNRNQLLNLINEGRAQKNELFFWDQNLVKAGAFLLEERLKLIDFLNERLSKLYQKMSGGQEEIQLVYRSNLDAALMRENAELAFSSKLLEKESYDLRYGHTTVGIHRDDVEFLLDEQKIDLHGSRGECRTLMLALKLAEIEFIELHRQQKPILLLDDVFSELDQGRQDALVQAIDQCQTFITTTDNHQIGNLKNLAEIRIVKGSIE